MGAKKPTKKAALALVQTRIKRDTYEKLVTLAEGEQVSVASYVRALILRDLAAKDLD